MTRFHALFCASYLATGGMGLPAAPIHVDQVEGQVLYGAGDAVPSVLVTGGRDFEPGTFSAGNTGILMLSTALGSRLRLGEMGTLRFLGEEPCTINEPHGRVSSFRLAQGKLTMMLMTPSQPPRCYRVEVKSGAVVMKTGMCVMCMHGDGAYVFVARGRASLMPAGATSKSLPVVLTGNGRVGMFGNDGTIQVRALTAVAAGTQTCLLGGFNPDAAGGGPVSHRVDAGAAIVSPIQ